MPSSEGSGVDSTAISDGFGRSAGGSTGAGGGNYGGSAGFTEGGSIWKGGPRGVVLPSWDVPPLLPLNRFDKKAPRFSPTYPGSMLLDYWSLLLYSS